ncbi:MAG: prenyltransferase/squalene oxidase repeat-containing protein, partial [Chloroflexota bacterium]
SVLAKVTWFSRRSGPVGSATTLTPENNPRRPTLKRLLLVWAMLAVALGSASAAMAKDDNREIREAMARGADRLVALQHKDDKDDGGWGRYPNDRVTRANLYGITARGLLAAYKVTKNPAYLQAAVEAGKALLAIYKLNPSGRPYSQDVEFLVDLSKATHDQKYSRVAKAWYANIIKDFPDANKRVDERLYPQNGSNKPDKRAGWAVASDIRAAKRTKQKQYARALAEAIIAQSGDWEGQGTELKYSFLGWGSLLWALHDLGDGYNSTIKAYRSSLLAKQEPDGSWYGADTQVTAYVVLGLSVAEGEGAERAVARAARFLLEMQLTNGGWLLYPPGVPSLCPNGVPDPCNERPEVDGEVLQALLYVQGEHADSEAECDD